MSITVRLDSSMEKLLKAHARRFSLSVTQVIKQLLKKYLVHEGKIPTPYELGHDLFGREGRKTASSDSKQYLKKKIHEKNFT